METLTTHQEESLTSADQNDNLETEGPKIENGDSHLHETATEDSFPQEELPTPEIQSDTVETPGIPNSNVDDDLVDSSTIQSLDDTEKLESGDNLKEDVADMTIIFCPESSLYRQDLVSWKKDCFL